MSAGAQNAEDTFSVYNSQTGRTETFAVDNSLTSLDGKPPKGNPTKSKVIINGEDWQQVDGNAYPYTASVYLVIQTSTHKKNCSGSVIGKYTVLTNAHCVYEDIGTPQATFVADVTAYAGGKKENAIRGKVTSFILSPSTQENVYSSDQYHPFDYAIIVLDTPIGEKSGFLGIKNTFNPSTGNTTLKADDKIAVIGFPGEKKKDNPWYSPGKILSFNTYGFYHTADVLHGSSGSPVFLQKDLTHIIAVASTGNEKKQRNGAVYSQKLLSFIKKYRHQVPTLEDLNELPDMSYTKSPLSAEEVTQQIHKGLRTDK